MLERVTKQDFAALGVEPQEDTVKRLEKRILDIVIEETRLESRLKALGQLRGCLEEFADLCKRGDSR
jgi:hypothetical protein